MTAPVLSSAAVREAARGCQFPLVGLAPAAALDPGPLGRWLAAGFAADMVWMERRVEDRLDPTRVLAGARTVIALAIPYYLRDARQGVNEPIARYARGRDYHYAHRDRMQKLRKRLLQLDPTVETYACVDTGVAMEKPWAQRAGLGWIGKNGCLLTVGHGSWVTLSVMFMDRAVDVYDQPHPDLCGDCALCLNACPTGAFPSPGVVDANRCISYQTIENRGSIPEEIRPRLKGHLFGCDICQDVCPYNRRDLPDGDQRFAARPLSVLAAEEIAALTEEQFDALSTGMALARVHYGGIRRNAVLAMSDAARRRCRPLLERLAADPDPLVADAARWALDQAR